MIRWCPPVFFSLLWLASFYAWLSTAIFEAREVPHSFIPIVILVLFAFLTVILYLAEGLEIAFTDLMDKDVDQFRDESTSVVLREIQGRVQFFFSQRQVFVVSIISFISILISTEVERFYVYGWGLITDPFTVGVINFVFINVLILCVCQVVPKRLAIINSERFLAQSKWLWGIIKFIGFINIPGPSDFIVPVLTKVFGYKTRLLPPSRASHFNSSALIHGHCVDQRATILSLRRDGSAEITRYFVALFLHGRRTAITGRCRAGEPAARYLAAGAVEILGAFRLPVVEDLKTHEPILDAALVAAKGPGITDAFWRATQVHPLTTLSARAEITVADLDAAESVPDWSIRFLDRLPEDQNPPEAPASSVCCIVYKVQGTAPPGAFYVSTEDVWDEGIPTACRKLYFSVASPADDMQVSLPDCTRVTLDATTVELAEEVARANAMLRRDQCISYPIQSARYRFTWRTRLSAAAAANAAQP